MVISIDRFNGSPADLATVLPITSVLRGYEWRVDLIPPEGGLPKPSQVICEQPRTVSISKRIQTWVGSVSANKMAEVDAVLRRLLAL